MYSDKHINDQFKALLEHNYHCLVVEVLYYMTHYYFRQGQDFTPQDPPDS